MKVERYTEYFDYLAYIRRCGIKTKMGAMRWLQNKFHITSEEARQIIAEWNRVHCFID